jgi:hypothetical protein
MRSQSILSFLALAVFFFSCEEPFTIDTEQAPPRVVIDGLITDNAAYQQVAIKWTTNFYNKEKSPGIENAVVTVSDDAGNVFNFVHNPSNHADSSGIYIPETPFAGEIGKTYFLHVEIDGEVYEATDKMADVIPVDSLTVVPDEDEQEDPEIDGRFYEVLLFAQEPQNERNFYLFKFYRNDSLTYDSETDIYFSDDELLAENIDGVEAPIYYSKGDRAKVEVFSMSRVGFVFYNDLFNLLNNDGGMFSPIPATPRTNLSNNALGFFHVGAVKTGEITID